MYSLKKSYDEHDKSIKSLWGKTPDSREAYTNKFMNYTNTLLSNKEENKNFNRKKNVAGSAILGAGTGLIMGASRENFVPKKLVAPVLIGAGAGAILGDVINRNLNKKRYRIFEKESKRPGGLKDLANMNYMFNKRNYYADND